MERSIENIWKTGFEAESELLAPRVAKLYKQKSKLVIERLKRSYKIDNGALPFMGLACLAIAYYAGYLWLGIYLLVLMISLFFLNRRQFGKLQKVQVTDDLYHYLSAYRSGLRRMIRFYTRLLGFGVPMLALPPMYIFLNYKHPGFWSEMLSTDPWVAIIGLLIIIVVLSGIGIGSYYFSTWMIYGRLIKKLDEMIADLEQLNDE